MIDTIRSEWIKFRTVRMNWVLGVIAVLFPVVTTLLFAWKAGGEAVDSGGAISESSPVEPQQVFNFLTASSIVMAMLLAVIGATAITSEFSTNTIRPTFAATPRRSRVVASKVIVTASVVAVISVVVAAASLVGSSAILSSRNSPRSFGDVPNLGIATVGFVLFTVIVSLLGLAVGLMLKSTPASVAVVVLWPLLIEPLLGTFLGFAGVDNAQRWMPYGAGRQLFDPFDGGVGLGRWGGGAYFLAVTAGLMLIGSAITSRRDA